jgi:N6-adenosine-specific RNA methylase IME4
LSFTHHAEVAVLGPAQQDVLLELAEAETLSTRDLRQEVRKIKSAESAGLAPTCESVTGGPWPTIVIDPPWQYGNRASRNAAENHYPTMTIEEIAALEVPAAENAHLYLWVTVGFVDEGFDLMEAWGFAYKTMLTWCKPQMGMGNYFRVSTEHVLFGVKGCLPTLQKNVINWFVGDRTQHSRKPDAFYDIVERQSPGQWMEMFARERRRGWATWGNQA